MLLKVMALQTTRLRCKVVGFVADWIWGNAKFCSSTTAASIPMLCVLVRDAKNYDKETGPTATIAASSLSRAGVPRAAATSSCTSWATITGAS